MKIITLKRERNKNWRNLTRIRKIEFAICLNNFINDKH